MLKWVNYPDSENSWEPEENINGCEALIEQCEAQYALRILGARRNENSVEYLIQFKDKFPNRIVSSAEAVSKWSSLVLNFLEQRITMVSQNDSTVQRRVTFISENSGIGNPIDVTCKNLVNTITLYFFMELLTFSVWCSNISQIWYFNSNKIVYLICRYLLPHFSLIEQ